jgi:hypothetical protein
MGQSIGDVSPPASPEKNKDKHFPSLSELGAGKEFDAHSESPYKFSAEIKQPVYKYSNLEA